MPKYFLAARTKQQMSQNSPSYFSPSTRQAHTLLLPETSQLKSKDSSAPVSTAGSSEDWSYLLTRWQDYDKATKLTGKDKVLQQLECCDEQLRKDLTRNTGGSLTNKTVDEVTEAIKKLAVREENTMAARIHLQQQVLVVLHSAHQDVTSMTACAESTVFWPGITPAITAL
jgi:hypothetical protein